MAITQPLGTSHKWNEHVYLAVLYFFLNSFHFPCERNVNIRNSSLFLSIYNRRVFWHQAPTEKKVSFFCNNSSGRFASSAHSSSFSFYCLSFFLFFSFLFPSLAMHLSLSLRRLCQTWDGSSFLSGSKFFLFFFY